MSFPTKIEGKNRLMNELSNIQTVDMMTLTIFSGFFFSVSSMGVSMLSSAGPSSTTGFSSAVSLTTSSVALHRHDADYKSTR